MQQHRRTVYAAHAAARMKDAGGACEIYICTFTHGAVPKHCACVRCCRQLAAAVFQTPGQTGGAPALRVHATSVSAAGLTAESSRLGINRYACSALFTWPTSMPAVFFKLLHGVYTIVTLFVLQPVCGVCVHEHGKV